MNQPNRVIINTFAQYVKTFLGIIIALLSTRIVLKQLGNDDFGLFSLVGSILAFLSFFNTALTRSTQRFLSYHIGINDLAYQRKILYNSFILHIGISLFVSVVMLCVEPLLFNGFLNIQSHQVETARLLYRLMIVSIFFSMNSAPFNAVFVSHENIVFSSVIYIVGALLKLLAAVALIIIENKLLLYGVFICLISVIEYFISVFSSAYMYLEVKTIFRNRSVDYSIFKSILAFSCYNLYGTLCIAGRNQGYAIVVNKFVSLEANASFGIANQVSGQVNSFVYSIATSISPVITKLEGMGDRLNMIKYTISASKISAMLYVLIAVPLIYEMELVLSLWLDMVPMYAKTFVNCILIANLLDSFSISFRTGVQAIGRIRNYFLVFYTIKIISIPISVIMLNFAVSPSMVLLPYIIVELLGTFISIYFFAKETNTSILYYLRNVVLKVLPILIVSLGVSYMMVALIKQVWLEAIAVLILPTITTGVIAYLFVLTTDEKNVLKRFFNKIFKK